MKSQGYTPPPPPLPPWKVLGYIIMLAIGLSGMVAVGLGWLNAFLR